MRKKNKQNRSPTYQHRKQTSSRALAGVQSSQTMTRYILHPLSRQRSYLSPSPQSPYHKDQSFIPSTSLIIISVDRSFANPAFISQRTSLLTHGWRQRATSLKGWFVGFPKLCLPVAAQNSIMPVYPTQLAAARAGSGFGERGGRKSWDE